LVSIELDLTVRTYDIDIAGHVNNVVFVRWLEDARVELFNKLRSIAELMQEGLFPVVTKTEIQYKRQIKLNDECRILMRLDSIRHSLMFLVAEVYVGDSLCAKATQQCAIIDLNTNVIKRVTLEDSFRILP